MENWIPFYEAIANGLRAFRYRRDELITGIHNIASNVSCLGNLETRFADNSRGPLRDICPFTVMGIFNRGITDENRSDIASRLASLLEVTEQVPDSFEGVPKLNNQQSWFFGHDNGSQQGEINTLWEVFDTAIDFADSHDNDAEARRSAFIEAYNDATTNYSWLRRGRLTKGLYWARPRFFPCINLDGNSKNYIENNLNIQIRDLSTAENYLELRQRLMDDFGENSSIRSFPELQLAALRFQG